MKYVVGALAVAGALAAGPALAATYTFDDPVTTGAQAPGVWYTDRYAPAGFTGGVSFDGREVLQVDISDADGASDRPGAFSSSFYNTQGRKLDMAAGTTSVSIELYLDEAWEGSGRRMAGLWGTGFDGADIAAYPIFEYTEEGPARFRAYEVTTGAWLDLGLPTGFDYGDWYTLNITLSGGQFTYSVGDLSVSTDANGATAIGNVILQGHNTSDGVSYSARWDNLTASVPEPATWALMIMGFGGAGVALRRRRTAAIAA